MTRRLADALRDPAVVFVVAAEWELSDLECARVLGYPDTVARYWRDGLPVPFSQVTFARSAYVVGIHRAAHTVRGLRMPEWVRQAMRLPSSRVGVCSTSFQPDQPATSSGCAGTSSACSRSGRPPVTDRIRPIVRARFAHHATKRGCAISPTPYAVGTRRSLSRLDPAAGGEPRTAAARHAGSRASAVAVRAADFRPSWISITAAQLRYGTNYPTPRAPGPPI